jgi:hypothetical protein
MTMNNDTKKQKARRMTELFDISRQRYLDAGGDARKSVNSQEWMSKEEQQEFFDLGNEVVTEEDVTAYLDKRGTWQERFAAFKAQMQSAP